MVKTTQSPVPATLMELIPPCKAPTALIFERKIGFPRIGPSGKSSPIPKMGARKLAVALHVPLPFALPVAVPVLLPFALPVAVPFPVPLTVPIPKSASVPSGGAGLT
ncbi:hypothetical protein D3C72_2121510 [compost metagenome]